MKNLLLIICFFPFAAFSQTKEDYQKVMDQFVGYYNNDQTDSVCSLFQAQRKYCFWSHSNPTEIKSKYGKIMSYAYLGVDKTDPEKVTVFKVVFEKKSVKATSFTLSKKMKFGTFRLDTSNDEIKKMLTSSN